MPRKKLANDKKKQSVSLTINTELLTIAEEHLAETGISNRSKYIEHLITQDLLKKGKDIKQNF